MQQKPIIINQSLSPANSSTDLYCSDNAKEKIAISSPKDGDEVDSRQKEFLEEGKTSDQRVSQQTLDVA